MAGQNDDSLKRLMRAVLKFRDAREWKQFHNFKDLAITLRAASPELGPDGKPLQPAIMLAYGRFLQSIIDFVIIAFCVFLLVKGMNTLRRRLEDQRPPKPGTPPEPTPQEKLLAEIRDLLRAKM